MTAYTAVMDGGWTVAATWGGGGYPNSLTDTANLAGFQVSLAYATVDCGQVLTNGGRLTVGTDGILGLGNSLVPAISVDATGHLILYGRIAGQETGNQSQITLATGATFTSPTGTQTLRRVLILHSISLTSSTIYGSTTEADQATCTLYPYTGGILTVSASCACAGMVAEYATLIINAGTTIKVNGGTFGPTVGGAIQIAGTKAAPVIIQSYSSTKWYFVLFGNALSYVDWLTFSGAYSSSLWDLGTNGFYFIRGPSDVSPVNRPAIIDVDAILGRISRTHYKGNEAAIVEINGIWAVSDKQYDSVDAMMRAGSVVGFVDELTQTAFPNARIIMHDYVRARGKLYWPYTITLLEARD